MTEHDLKPISEQLEEWCERRGLECELDGTLEDDDGCALGELYTVLIPWNNRTPL